MNKLILPALITTLISSTVVNAGELYKDDKNTFSLNGNLSVYYLKGEDFSEVRDGFSRFNLDANRDLGDGWSAFTLLEYGIQVSSTGSGFHVGNEGLTSTGSTTDSIWLRHGYVGFKHDAYGQLSMGKQWGVSYDIGGMTDWWEVFGGDAQGTYNFGTDGGFSGTGRAEQSVKYKLSINNLTVSAQFLATDEILDLKEISNPNQVPPYEGTLNVEDSYGASLTYKAPFNIGLGVAYNHAKLSVGDSAGLFSDSVDDELIGGYISYRNFGEQGLHMALVLTDMKYHEINDTGKVMEDANGIEFLAMYRFNGPWALLGGFISLSDESTVGNGTGSNGKFKNEYYLLSARYFWDERFYLYAEQKIDNSVASSPLAPAVPGNAIGLGMRYDF